MIHKQRNTVVLIGTLLASASIYTVMARLHPTNGIMPVAGFLGLMALLFALYAVASLAVAGLGHRPALLIVFTGAVLFRIILLPAGSANEDVTPTASLRGDLRGTHVGFDRFLLFDNDIWRYVWEGHVGAHGLNPFALAPANAALDRLTDTRSASSDQRQTWADIRDNVSYQDVPTIYPPLAQATFRLAHGIAPGSVLMMKSLIVVVDVLAIGVLTLALCAHGRPPASVVLYAWNPLVIKAFAGSGHIDAVAVLFVASLLWSIGRWRWLAAASLAMAVLAKLTPLVLLPLVARRIGWKPTVLALVIVLAGFAPFASAGSHVFDGLRTFAAFWRFNGGPFEFVRWAFGHAGAANDASARAVCAALALAVCAVIAWRDDGRPETFAAAGALTLGAVVVFSPAVMPWYLTLVLPLAVVSRQDAWLAGSALACLAFLVMIDGVQRPAALFAEYGLFALVALRTPLAQALRRTACYLRTATASLAAPAMLALLLLVPAHASAQGSGSLGAGPGAFTVTMSFSGTVAEVASDPNTFTVRDKKGKEHQFKVSDQSTFTREEKGSGKKKVSFTDVAVGSVVKVSYRASDEVAIDVRITPSE